MTTHDPLLDATCALIERLYVRRREVPDDTLIRETVELLHRLAHRLSNTPHGGGEPRMEASA